MAQILLVEENENLRMVLKLNAVKLLGVDVIEKDSSADAVSFIQILPDLDLIICKENIAGATDVISHLVSEQLSIPILWVGKNQPNYKNAKLLASDITWENIVAEGGKILGIEAAEKNDSTEGYMPIDCRYFLNITSTSLGCDVYIKLKKTGVDHYVKCLHSTDKFARADIEKYMGQGLKEFHIPTSHFNQFVNFVTNQMVEKLDSALSGEERIAVTAESYKISMERIESLGMDEFAVSIVEANVKSIISSISEANALGSFLKRMKEDPLTYSYANSYLIGLILHKVIDRFDWASPAIKAKLTYVAYFHNFALKDEKLQKIKSSAELKAANLTQAEIEAVLNHANLGASIIERFPGVPDGAAIIIREHHGAKNGIGFPDVLSPQISSLSMMFIVVEDFVDEFLKVSDKPTKADFDRIFAKLNERYTKLTYAQALGALTEMILKK